MKHIYALEKTRSTPPQPKMVGKLHHSPCKSLTRADLRRKKTFIQNKTKQETRNKKIVATGVEEMMNTS
jgi:hypothetical protein